LDSLSSKKGYNEITYDIVKTIMEKKILALKPGQKIRSKRDKTLYEIRSVMTNHVTLISEDGVEYLNVPVESITFTEYEPVYD